MHPNPSAGEFARRTAERLDRVWRRGEKLERAEALQRMLKLLDPSYDARQAPVGGVAIARGGDPPPPFIDVAMAEAQLGLLIWAGWIVCSGPADALVYERPKDDPKVEQSAPDLGTKEYVPPTEKLQWVDAPDGSKTAVIVSYPGYEGPRRI